MSAPPVDAELPRRRSSDRRIERQRPFRPPVTAFRWGAVAVGAALAASDGSAWSVGDSLGLAAVAAVAAFWSWRPLGQDASLRHHAGHAVELLLVLAAVLPTGRWDSPFAFSLVAAVGAAGFTVGFAHALRLALVAVVATSVPYVADDALVREDAVRHSLQWAIELVLVAAIAGYARRLWGDAEERHVEALDRVGRLSEANRLLSSLHEVAQDLPASLDLEQVLDSTTARLRSFWDLSGLAVLVEDETSGQWLTARQEGVRLPFLVAASQLPPTLRQAVTSSRTVTYPVLQGSAGGPGLSPGSGSGLYAPLRARGRLVGLLALEHGEPGRFDASDVELLDGFTESAALAIDNARWFARLRTVGADAERNRIARELHDRVGQSLASLGFELDGLRGQPDDGLLRDGIDRLRVELRGAMGEIRDTLHDLRTEVSEERGLVATLELFLERVERRTGVGTALHADPEALRLPILQEREMWRIAQEAITNAERHGHPSRIDVWWHCDGLRAELEVTDDGVGFDVAARPGVGSYGMLGMRERAAGIGAALLVDSAPGRGARVRCSLGAA